MPKMDIQKELNWVMEHGELTLSDVSRWLQCPVPSVRNWVLGLTIPRERRRKHIEYRLSKLKNLIAVQGTIIPIEINEHDRPAYIRKKANDECGGISRKNTTSPRKLLSRRVLQE